MPLGKGAVGAWGRGGEEVAHGRRWGRGRRRGGGAWSSSGLEEEGAEEVAPPLGVRDIGH